MQRPTDEPLSKACSAPAGTEAPIQVRPYRAGDEAFIRGLAPRLLTGIPPWRSADKWLEAVQGWLTQDFEKHGKQSMLFVAEDEQGERLGFANVADGSHFTGEPHAYLGELAVSEVAEGRGVGQALVHACEQWAHVQGYRLLVLDTGAIDNERARRFYDQLGYQPESIKLAKLLDGAGDSQAAAGSRPLAR